MYHGKDPECVLATSTQHHPTASYSWSSPFFYGALTSMINRDIMTVNAIPCVITMSNSSSDFHIHCNNMKLTLQKLFVWVIGLVSVWSVLNERTRELMK